MRRNEEYDCCGNCKFNKWNQVEQDFFCNNPNSDFYQIENDYDYCCADYERR